ncbi:hypothetical protein [Streptomyces sp. NPDC047024]|uniref:hypothetical protein n=1 Tax=Streptomyces sp. NPDC047024 TaxID=3155476 RepID=UPI0033FBC51F
MHTHGRDKILDTACSDHDPVMFPEGTGVTDPDAVPDDPEWVEWRGGDAHESTLVVSSAWGWCALRGRRFCC